jgi:HlyD family secretion protein
MATRTEGERRPPPTDQGIHPASPPAGESAVATGQAAGQPPNSAAGQARSGRKKRGWVRVVRRWLLGIALVVISVMAYLIWLSVQPDKLPPGFASSNGRIEATEVDAATKLAGRIAKILVDEGDFVTAGQVVAHMDTATLEAELREAQAKHRQAISGVESAKSTVAQRESEKAAALSKVRQREAEHDLATKNLARGQQLVVTGAMSKEDVDARRASLYSAQAAVDSAKAEVAAADAAIATARSFVITAEAYVEAAEATIERVRADLNDGVLRAPRDGRVQYRVAQPGEVLSGGGKVLNMVDLGDVYMTFFLPTDAAGRVRMGADVHLVLDALPQYVVPAKVTFVADVAQFTPKTVETAVERQKLTFRLKAHIPQELLKKYIRNVKTGLPGVAYVQLDPQAKWPDRLQVRLPQ